MNMFVSFSNRSGHSGALNDQISFKAQSDTMYIEQKPGRLSFCYVGEFSGGSTGSVVTALFAAREKAPCAALTAAR